MLLETILGSVTGLVGTAVSQIFKYKNTKLELDSIKIKNEHEVKMVEAETKAMILEAKANIKVTQAQVEGAIEIEDSKIFLEAQKQGNKNIFDNKWIDALMGVQGKWRIITIPVASVIASLFGFVDFLRGLIRPALTVYLCGCTTWITWMAWQIMQKNSIALTTDQAVVIFSDVTNIVTYLTVSCVTWWFGDRVIAKTIMNLKGADRTKLDDEVNIK